MLHFTPYPVELVENLMSLPRSGTTTQSSRCPRPTGIERWATTLEAASPPNLKGKKQVLNEDLLPSNFKEAYFQKATATVASLTGVARGKAVPPDVREEPGGAP